MHDVEFYCTLHVCVHFQPEPALSLEISITTVYKLLKETHLGLTLCNPILENPRFIAQKIEI